MDQLLTVGHGGGHSADTAFDEEFDINGAGLKAAEAVFEGVLEMIEAKMLGTSLVGSVKKRAMIRAVVH